MTSRKNSSDSAYVKSVVNATIAKPNESKIQIIHTNERGERTSLGFVSRLEHRFTISDLEELKEAFENEDVKYTDGMKLNRRTFATFLTSVVNKGSLSEYEDLFDNIDITKTGFVDWNKFAEYMLHMLYETDDKTKAYSIPNWKPAKNINNQHRDAIKRIQYVKNLNVYISISKEGTCCVFDNNVNMTLHSKISSTSCKARDLWVTDFIVMTNVNKIAVAFTTKEIEIYDCSKLDFNCQFRITNLPATALSLDYWYDENNDNDAILVWGDTIGNVHSIHFNSAKIALFERPSGQSGAEKQDICLQVNIDEIKTSYKNAMYICYKAHSGWVKQVKWANHLECIISCCASDKGSVNLGWFEKTNTHMRVPCKKADFKIQNDNDYYYPSVVLGNMNRDNNSNNNNNASSNNANNESSNPSSSDETTNANTTMNATTNNNMTSNAANFIAASLGGSIKNFNSQDDGSNSGRNNFIVPIRSYVKSSQFDIPNGGVNGFDYDEKMNLIATANANNSINIYNPYVQEANGILKGHMRGVLAVKFVQSRGQLISFSKDKVLRVWNVSLQMGIQRVANIFPKGPDVDITCYFDDNYNRLFTTFRNLIIMLEIKPEIKDRVMTHNKPVVASRLNKINNQVLTLSQDGTLIMWLIDNGQKIKTLTELHGTAEVTCMEFDESNTKFFTGATDGTIKIWDFTGHCYHTLDAGDGHSCEISQIIPLKRRIISVGWTKQIAVFRDSTFKDHRVKPSEWKGKQEHDEDILCTALQKNQPMQLATGSFDGDIVLWNSVTELPSKHIIARKRIPTKRNLPSYKKENTASSIKSEKIRHKSSKTASRRSTKAELTVAIDPENDFSYAITCLRYLQTRTQTKDATMASCGGNGWLRFWDLLNAELVAEFIAHQQVSSIIMELDPSEQYLATGDVNGIVKVWNIADYCRNIHSRTEKTVDTIPPPLVSTIKSHTDVINSIDFCHRNSTILIIIGSSDCSASLHNIFGVKIGIFGQEEHWKVENFFFANKAKEEEAAEEEKKIENKSQDPADETDYVKITPRKQNEKQFESNSLGSFGINMSELGLISKLNKQLTVEDTFTYEEGAFVKNPSLRYNPWSKTLLEDFKYFETTASKRRGRSYQEARVKKRDRKQPGIIATEEFLLWEKTGQTPGGLYGSLQTAELAPASELKEPKKPDFMKNPQRYFRDKDSVKFNDLDKHIPTLAETLNSAFDEKILFPKYILDYEARMRQEHRKIIESAAATTVGNAGNTAIDTGNFTKKKRQNSISSVMN